MFRAPFVARLLLGSGLLGAFAASSAAAANSIARTWNEQILSAIRIDLPNPPVHARNLFHLATVMYDAWAAYDTVAVGFLHHERAAAGDVDAARREAISYAAYRLLKSRYAGSANAATTMAALDAQFTALGYDSGVTTTVGTSPAAVGNRIAADVMAWGLTDGSNQAGSYQDFTYFNTQPVMIVLQSGSPVGGIPAGTDPNRWQPLALDAAVAQNGIPVPNKVQNFVGVTWLQAQPFSLARPDSTKPWLDSGAPSKLGEAGDAIYKAGAMDVLEKSALLDDATLVDTSAAGMGNNTLGQDDGHGRATNPVTGAPYTPSLVKNSDYARVLAEFWADGPNSETPPGHWHVLANQVTDHPLTQKKIGGAGAVVSDLEWDVKMYFALAGATHNAACAAWSNKRYYEGVRPITMIRYMCSKGQSSDPLLPSYHPQGIPLKAGVTEVITAATTAPGQRHAALAGNEGKIAVYSWPGEPPLPATQVSQVRWMLGTDWLPYQRKTFNTPAFPGLISGHSTFSRAAAEVLAKLTNSVYFPGGAASFTAAANSYLVFEDGPSTDVTLQWSTYYDAADQAGLSRRWGGIHVPEDDYRGRVIGAQCGVSAWDYARKFWDGSILSESLVPALRVVSNTECRLEWPSVRGQYYQLQSSTDFLTWSDLGTKTRATDATTTHTDSGSLLAKKFFRVVRTVAP